mgnify:CR=1 FL=1
MRGDVLHQIPQAVRPKCGFGPAHADEVRYSDHGRAPRRGRRSQSARVTLTIDSKPDVSTVHGLSSRFNIHLSQKCIMN